MSERNSAELEPAEGDVPPEVDGLPVLVEAPIPVEQQGHAQMNPVVDTSDLLLLLDEATEGATVLRGLLNIC